MRNLTERLPRDLLKWTAAGFALVATATAEYEIARAIGMNEWIAAAVPGALDAYVVRALRTHREVLTSVVAMVGVNAASHLVTAGILPVEWPLITAVSAIAPLVLWRVHALGTPGEARRRVLWGLPWRARPVEHASTPLYPCDGCDSMTCTGAIGGPCGGADDEHGRAPDNPEPPGTREHPEHKANAMGLDVPESEHIACTECGAVFPDVPDLEAHQRDAGHGVLGRVHAASTDDLDVPDWMNPPSTPPVPVHAPYADHVHGGAYEPDHAAPNGTRLLRVVPVEHADGHTSTGPLLLPFLPSTEPMKARHLEVVKGHAPDPEDWTDPDREHTASTRTADDWNLEHVSTGTLTPEDTEHMERARELFHTIGGVPPFRALKEGDPGMGTPRAKRIRAALKIENEGTD